MRVSIVIPALNEADGIDVCVERAWAVRPQEVLVVDGGSHDGTAEIARRSNARVVVSPPGRAIQQNHGALWATGDVLLFLHADCWLAPQAVAQLEAALADPSVPGGAFRQRIEADGAAFRLIEAGNAWRVRLWGLPLGDQGIFLRRDVFESLGRFPEVALLEDVLLMRRLRRWARPVLLPGPIHVSPRRWRRHGLLRQTLRNWRLLAAERRGVPLDQLALEYRQHWESR